MGLRDQGEYVPSQVCCHLLNSAHHRTMAPSVALRVEDAGMYGDVEICCLVNSHIQPLDIRLFNEFTTLKDRAFVCDLERYGSGF